MHMLGLYLIFICRHNHIRGPVWPHLLLLVRVIEERVQCIMCAGVSRIKPFFVAIAKNNVDVRQTRKRNLLTKFKRKATSLQYSPTALKLSLHQTTSTARGSEGY